MNMTAGFGNYGSNYTQGSFVLFNSNKMAEAGFHPACDALPNIPALVLLPLPVCLSSYWGPQAAGRPTTRGQQKGIHFLLTMNQ